MAEVLTVKVRRSGEDGASRFETFRVEREPRMNVLDVVAKIQSTLDATLAYRYCCRAGMCGTCSMRVNGRNRWTCRTAVDGLGTDTLVLEPLPHFPVVRDLVVDMAPFNERNRRLNNRFVPKEPHRQDFARIPADSAERLDIDPQIQCITCGNCFGECSLVETNADYLGPAALNRAFTLVADSRDGATAERLELLNSHAGVWGCHTQFNCTEVCPMGISPTRAIQKLKRREIVHALTKHFR